MVALESLLEGKNYLSNMEDTWIWFGNSTGIFTVKSVREIIDSTIYTPEPCAFKWNRWLLIKINCFIWRLLLNRILVTHNLAQRSVVLPSILWGFKPVSALVSIQKPLFQIC